MEHEDLERIGKGIYTEGFLSMYLECHNNQKQQETSKRKYLIVKLF